MRTWKLILLGAGIVLLVASLVAYVRRIESCYPPANIYNEYSPDQAISFRERCLLDSSLTTQFGSFLLLYIPGILLFTSYWLLTRPTVKNRRAGQLNAFLILLIFDSLLVMLYGMLGYPAPGIKNAPAPWAAEVIAALGFLCYLAALALWHWKRIGLLIFQGASIILAGFILLGGGSFVLAAVIVGGVIFLSLFLRPLRAKLD